MNLPLNQTLLTFLVYMSQTWMTQLILAISLWGVCLPLNRKDSITHMHGLAVYVEEGLPFAQDLSLEDSADSYLCFWLAVLHLVSYFFFLYRPPPSSLSGFSLTTRDSVLIEVFMYYILAENTYFMNLIESIEHKITVLKSTNKCLIKMVLVLIIISSLWQPGKNNIFFQHSSLKLLNIFLKKC